MYKEIPSELKEMKRWIVYKPILKNGKTQKVPINPLSARSLAWSDKTQWLSFNDAKYLSQHHDNYGIGFILGDGVAGIDLDNVVKVDGTLQEIATDVISSMNSYTEYSLSGKGVHILFLANLPHSFNNRKKILNHDGTYSNIEMYSSGRFFVVTGNIYNNEFSNLFMRENEAIALYNKYITALIQTYRSSFGSKSDYKKEYRYAQRNAIPNQPDAQIWEKARKDIQKVDYTDASRGDWNAILILKHYTNDKDQIERIMREYTGKYRIKWDSMRTVNSGSKKTYLRLSIDKAFA